MLDDQTIAAIETNYERFTASVLNALRGIDDLKYTPEVPPDALLYTAVMHLTRENHRLRKRNAALESAGDNLMFWPKHHGCYSAEEAERMWQEAKGAG